MRTLIIGMCNPYRRGDPLNPGKTAGRRLFECSGFSLEEYEAAFERVNLLPRDKTWDQKKAARAAARLRIEPGRKVILLGQAVARAFREAGKDYHGMAVIPHPSGLNRKYNDPIIRKEVGAILRRNGKSFLKAQ